MTTITPARHTAIAPRARIATLRVLAVVAVLATAAVGMIVHLNRNAQQSTRAELRLSGMARDLLALQDVPFRARPRNGGTPAVARMRLRTGERRVLRVLARLNAGSPPPQLRPVPAGARAFFGKLHEIYLVAVSPAGYGPRADRLGAASEHELQALNHAINAAGRAYADRAARAQDDVLAGSGMAIAMLFVAFAFFQRRAQVAHDESRRLAEENGRLLDTSRQEARTDALTGLPNRRALIADLTAALAWEEQRQTILILFDLDGFKQYNDAFGHPAGDLLLQRLGQRLQAAVTPGAVPPTGWAATSSACSRRRRTPRARCGPPSTRSPSAATDSRSERRTASPRSPATGAPSPRSCTSQTCACTTTRRPAGRPPAARAPMSSWRSSTSAAPTCSSTCSASPT